MSGEWIGGQMDGWIDKQDYEWIKFICVDKQGDKIMTYCGG